ncbi:hypothetical protein NC652_034057 [Populus alba x Populus x berolinensis]|uniref:Uncharacterized protein n=1 Tax=Populus alba x Populus x berolinensis TaxID=444605 RepID=A0AAD6LV13_9ROSI|nr:hypothetical protein NC652_034057 [Populus alba x Populus x berolinensis]KAJ6973767.1 hypothetical protein NC653_033945 [Populus alba x Populus x berolinensis]KAJ6973773.1 hypothetical protein NC653_033947 [Populus alba x Populus x berolinensis]KAJ6973892.1 hypothetical protein NC653_034039 [Populus alba x Populus x berolinensis]
MILIMLCMTHSILGSRGAILHWRRLERLIV